MSRIILHCDMNNFYASVECFTNPDLRDKCVAVCGSVEDRHGIVLAKNEKAKRFGVKTAETVYSAKRKCPGLVIVPPHFDKYAYYSKKAFDIYCRYTELVEPFGMDECWLDVTGSTLLFGNGEKIANEIRTTIKKELGLTVSIGVSFNKVFAKLGSDLKKPDAVTVISEQNYKQITNELPVNSIIGIGKSATEILHRIGIDTIGELAEMPKDIIIAKLGKQGEMIWRFANGIDDSPVMSIDYDEPAKSIGRGTTTRYDLTDTEEVSRILLMLSRQVSAKLRSSGLIASGVQISVRDSTLKIREYQSKLLPETNSGQMIYEQALTLFKARYGWEKNVRSLTVRAINLIPYNCARQLNLFDSGADVNKKERIDRAEDEITKRFGKGMVKPMSLLGDLPVPDLRKEE